TLYHHTGKKYLTVKPNKHGRYAIPELDLEVGLLDGWPRYWYQGELLLLPADLQRDLNEARRRADEEKRRADEEKRRADEEKRRADELQRRLAAAERELEQYRTQGKPATPRRNNGANRST